MRLGFRDRVSVSMSRIIDSVQHGILENYPLFTFLVGNAPQRPGSKACYARAFKEFETAAQNVPAYKRFLEDRRWESPGGGIRAVFESLPVMDKTSYILPYSTEDRCLGGEFFQAGVVIDESSGATGIPYNWVRSERERETVKKVIAVYLRYCFGADRFIVLNTFSMGAWATGFNMALAAQSLGVVKSTGPDVDKIFHTLQFFGSKYPYIVIGYPPFMKYLIDEGEKRGFPWQEYTIHAMVGGEGMSEGLRDYVSRHARSVFSGYGASDLEIGIGGENPLSVRIRKMCLSCPELRRTLFGSDQRLPMLFQYNPLDHLIEIVDGEVVVTISKPWTLSPRIRYNIRDEGGMITFTGMKDKLARHGIDLMQLARECHYPRWQLPFLFVYGRKDSTISVMGANIYPEDVENVVYSDPELGKRINSYMLSVEEDGDGNPRPCFEFELLDPDLDTGIAERLAAILPDGLARLSLDFKKARDEYPQAVEPIVRVFGPDEGPFRQNVGRIKKKYVKRD